MTGSVSQEGGEWFPTHIRITTWSSHGCGNIFRHAGHHENFEGRFASATVAITATVHLRRHPTTGIDKWQVLWYKGPTSHGGIP